MPTDTTEKGLEDIIIKHLTANNGYELGNLYGKDEYDKEYAIDITRLFRFLKTTQARELAKLDLDNTPNGEKAFLTRLSNDLKKHGVIDLLRNGFRYNHVKLELYFVLPSKENPEAIKLWNQNIFSVTRQLQYSHDQTKLAVDFVIFLNGLPTMTFELKNNLTKQNVHDAIYQYQTDRDPSDLLFSFKRCLVHFAVDDNEVMMCSELKGKSSWFLPFNKGHKDGKGNPPNPDGLKTDYLWKETLKKEELGNIIQNFAQVIAEENEDTGKKKEKQIFPRYHQLDVVKKLISDTAKDGVGHKYLIQHSAGSGKSNSIAWLAHQLVGIQLDTKALFDTIIVVTDRVNLDKQIKNTIRKFMQVNDSVGHASNSGELRQLLAEGKKIIITIIHKFQYILDGVDTFSKNQNFAIIIDEAHSSQSGRLSSKMSEALSEGDDEENYDIEDKIIKIIEGKKMLKNASYFAFTATPKNKTLEMFGHSSNEGDQTKFYPYHKYTMKQAIEEGFILDVLKHYTPINSYYKIIKTIENDPHFDKKKAQKKLKWRVESDEHPIKKKANIIVDHFHNEVVSRGKIKGNARAMVVTGNIKRAIDYFFAIKVCLEDRRSQFKAIIAYSGEKEINGKMVSESDLNDFPSNQIEKKFKTDPYRILVVADKFQTGFDEPLLHTMYIDKTLTSIAAVQTLSRLNRAMPGKRDTFIIDFVNQVDDVTEAFSKYYKTTILSDETDPNKLNDLIGIMTNLQVYTEVEIDILYMQYINNFSRETLDPILDRCVEKYNLLSTDDQIKFKGSAKNFTRTYNFLVMILPYNSIEWEKLATFLTFLIPKLPSPIDEDLAEGILETVDLESYRTEKQSTISIDLPDEDAEIDPIPISGSGGKKDPEMETLSTILESFNHIWGNINWTDSDKIKKDIEDLYDIINNDEKYQNTIKNSDEQTAREVCKSVTEEEILKKMTSMMELFREFSNNSEFKQWLLSEMFRSTYKEPKRVSNNSE